MAIHGEAVLRARLCLGRACNVLFFICSHCDRGQRYCGAACSTTARQRQRRAANRRHQTSPEGRLDHRDRQRQYRRRRAQARVTDQGSHSIISPAISNGGEEITEIAATVTATAPAIGIRTATGFWLRCCYCGRSGRFVNPFPGSPKRRRFERSVLKPACRYVVIFMPSTGRSAPSPCNWGCMPTPCGTPLSSKGFIAPNSRSEE